MFYCRYTEALVPIDECLGLCKSKKGLKKAYQWPGTEKFIENTDANILKVTAFLIWLLL